MSRVSKVEVGVKLVVSMFSMFSMIFLLALVRGRRPPLEFVDAIIRRGVMIQPWRL